MSKSEAQLRLELLEALGRQGRVGYKTKAQRTLAQEYERTHTQLEREHRHRQRIENQDPSLTKIK
jgi:hypothetical protein